MNIDIDYNKIDNINRRIKNEIDYLIIEKLNDNNLLEDYKNTLSVKNEIDILKNILKKYITIDSNDIIIQNIINEYLPNLIPPGTKGNIIGNKFNIFIKDEILKLNLDKNIFEIQFEKKSNKFEIDEIPDWYILHKKSHKIMIGMNQLDLWSGGHQINRGMKYLSKNLIDTNSKLLCVICNDIIIKSNKNKVYKIFKLGFENNTLCYINNLKNIIFEYFNIAETEQETKQKNINNKTEQESKQKDINNKTKQESKQKDTNIENNNENNNENEYKQETKRETKQEIKQNTGLKRNIIDKFYTNLDIVKICIKYIKQKLLINYEDDLIIEPSAGNGSFICEIKNMCLNYIFYDIEPENNDIIKQDYLNFDHNIINSKYKNIHIIGNPPFGRQLSSVKKFIKKSCLFADTISFILPRSFKKDNVKKIFDIKFHLLFEFDLPKNSFTNNNKYYNIPCVFQIWKKEIFNRKIINIIKPIGFSFVKKNENPDISFRRVGSNAGIIDKNIEAKNINSHYFIKFDNNNYDLNKLSNIKFNNDNTVGPKSISKQELIIEFNKYFI
jgi:hypothetical protein